MEDVEAIRHLVDAVSDTCRHLATECAHRRLTPGCRVCGLRVEALGSLDEYEEWVMATQVLRDRLDNVARMLLQFVEERSAECSWCVDLAAVLAESADDPSDDVSR